MKNFKLSVTAEVNIDAIASFTDEAFGERQTEAYLSGLERSVELLSEFPGIGAAAFEIKQGWRRYRYQSHYIFYTEHDDYVLIEAIVHVRRQLGPDLFDN